MKKKTRQFMILNQKLIVDSLELEAECILLTGGERVDRRDRKQKILHLENMAKLDLIQKSHIEWLSDGDENSRFFHNSIKVKNSRKNIHGFMINGSWITDCNAINSKLGGSLEQNFMNIV